MCLFAHATNPCLSNLPLDQSYLGRVHLTFYKPYSFIEDSTGPRFESSHRQKIVLNIHSQLYWNDKNKEKEAVNGPLIKQSNPGHLIENLCGYHWSIRPPPPLHSHNEKLGSFRLPSVLSRAATAAAAIIDKALRRMKKQSRERATNKRANHAKLFYFDRLSFFLIKMGERERKERNFSLPKTCDGEKRCHDSRPDFGYP